MHADLGLPAERAEDLANLANVRLVQGRAGEAQRLLEEALDLARSVGAERVVGSCLGSMGNVAMTRGDLPEAETRFREGLAAHERAGWTEGIGIQWTGLAQVHNLRACAFTPGAGEGRARGNERKGA